MTPQSLHLVDPPPSDPRDHAVLSAEEASAEQSAIRALETRNRERDQIDRERALLHAEDFHLVCEVLKRRGEIKLRQLVDDAVLQQHAGRAAGAFSGDGL